MNDQELVEKIIQCELDVMSLEDLYDYFRDRREQELKTLSKSDLLDVLKDFSEGNMQ